MSKIVENMGADAEAQLSQRLLAWYARNARSLPWRAPPGSRVPASPYAVWLSEIMLQQTTVRTVIPYFEKFRRTWPTVYHLAQAELDMVLAAWAGLGYYTRARNLHKCAQVVVNELGGRFPETEQGLLALPGIGPYTAAAIAAIAFGQPATVVDGNVERVVARLFAVDTPLPAAKPELRRLAARLTPKQHPGDHAQAMMDLGATICTPRTPTCPLCPLRSHCHAAQAGLACNLPYREAKKPRPVRRGAAFLLERPTAAVPADREAAPGREILLCRRPPKGLLAGMMELPGTDWGERFPTRRRALQSAPAKTQWHRCPGLVAHTFTHFHLELQVYRASIARTAPLGPDMQLKDCRWVAWHELPAQALPSLMRKAINHANGPGIGADE